MSGPAPTRSRTAKVATAFSLAFLVSAGLCGANFGAAYALRSSTHEWLVYTALAETFAMIVSLAGLVITAVVGIVVALNDRYNRASPYHTPTDPL